MLVVHVHVRVEPADLEAFLAETRRNAAASLEEPGVRRRPATRLSTVSAAQALYSLAFAAGQLRNPGPGLTASPLR
jgi:hypothetical protein